MAFAVPDAGFFLGMELICSGGVEQCQDFDRGGGLAVAYAEFLQGEGDEQ